MGTNGTNKIINSGLFVMIGLIVLGIFLFSAVKAFKSYDRVVSVKGLAELEVPADKVIWPIAFKEIGNDLNSLYQTINQKNKIIKDFLISKGLTEAEITISAPKIIDMNAERYQSQPSTYRYNITSVLTVTSDKVELV